MSGTTGLTFNGICNNCALTSVTWHGFLKFSSRPDHHPEASYFFFFLLFFFFFLHSIILLLRWASKASSVTREARRSPSWERCAFIACDHRLCMRFFMFSMPRGTSNTDLRMKKDKLKARGGVEGAIAILILDRRRWFKRANRWRRGIVYVFLQTERKISCQIISCLLFFFFYTFKILFSSNIDLFFSLYII